MYRLYCLEGLQLRMKVKRRKRIAMLRGKVTPATGPNQHWSMDLVHVQTLNGRKFRILTVIDQWSRESVSLEADFRLTGRCVGEALDEAPSCADGRRRSRSTMAPNSPPRRWTNGPTGGATTRARASRPTNGLIESFNGRPRDEFLNANELITMHDVRQKLKTWQDDYNHYRPHGSLGHLTPSEFAKMRSGQPHEAARL